MTTSSARPDHLRRYAADTQATVAQAGRTADDAARAATRFAATGGDGGLATPAVLAARSALERLGTLASATRSIGDAFAAADLGPAGGLATAGDLAVSRALQASAAGLADDELLGPRRFDAGRAFAESLEGLPLQEQLERLQHVEDEDVYGPAFAAGVIQTLGADGLTDLVERTRVTYEDGQLGLTRADAGLDALGELFQDAGRTVVPVGDPASLAASMAPAAAGRTPYDLDLGLLRRLGQTATGRNTLRQLVLNAPDLSTPVTVTVATAIARPHRVDADRPVNQGSFKLLDDRQVRQWDVAAPELPMLVVLARDPLAAFAWDEARPGGRSPVAGYLPQRGPAETNELARITHSVLVESVRQGWAEPYEIAAPRPNGGGSTSWATAPTSLPEIIAAAGQADPTPALTRTMAEVLDTHGEAFRERAATELYRDVDDQTLTDYFRVLSADRDALAAATDIALDGYHAEAARVLAQHPPTDPSVDLTDITSGLGDSHGVLLAVERGAVEAGEHHNALAGFAVTAVGFGLGQALDAASGSAGPAGAAVIGLAGGAAIDAGTQAATDRWVDTQDGRSEKGAVATERAEPYLLAVAMAEDAAWGEAVIEPGGLAGLDVVGSAEDRRAFARWLAQQPPVVREPIVRLMAAAA